MLKLIAIAVMSCLAFGTSASANNQTAVIVLVPGFFNSLIPSENSDSSSVSYRGEPYFSKAIVQTIQRRGLDVVIADTLLPLGTVDGNGARLEKFLVAVTNRYTGRKMILLTHSAGGLYALRALTNRPSLPVQTVVSMATPFAGVEFVDHLTADVPGIDQLAHFLNLESLREFETKKMAPLLSQYRVPFDVRWIAVAGYQPPCHYLFDCGDSRKLSWLLSLTQALMTHPSDGVVTVSSALGEGAQILRSDGRALQIEAWADMVIPLEHWEMVQESVLFHALGVFNTNSIRVLQQKTFDAILDRLGPEISSSSSVNPSTP